jgi:hypothetical protein
MASSFLSSAFLFTGYHFKVTRPRSETTKADWRIKFRAQQAENGDSNRERRDHQSG